MKTADPRLMTLFSAARDRASEAERSAFLDEACGGDAVLRAEVEALLKAEAEAGGFLESPGPNIDSTVSHPTAEGPGTVIGPYKLVELIADGGMGTVWMARQSEPVKRLVALKVIKAGTDSKQVLARFEAERQALALMDHPNIAKVLDAGAIGDSSRHTPCAEGDGTRSVPITMSGRPYFVMELVKGVPITKFCDDHRLTPRQRLELFVPICHAIQHAHQKGIIHRDVKPSNVLVALYDDKPVPKVIDFGVAKATGQQLTEQSLHTSFGAVVGTVEYMSPEQATFNQLDVDTRSDIYSLGVLLYELLTGSPPFTKKELEKAGMLEMLRVIREQEPSKPSTKLSTADGLPTLAANRGTEPAKLTKLVRGELDWIVMKALEKDRNRRYETANGFAMDVQRYLTDAPVQACPPTMRYRFRKFVRRNKGPVLAVTLVMLALVAGIVGTTWGMFRAEAARREAVLAQNQQLAALYNDRAYIHARDGQWEQAAALSAQAIELGADPADLETNFWQLPWLRTYLGDEAEHRGICLRLLERYEQTSNPWHALQAARICILRPDRAIDPPRVARLIKRAIDLKPDSPHHWDTLGLAYYRAGDWNAAVAAHEKARPLRDRYGSVSEWRFVLAMAHWKLNEQDQARKWFDEGIQWLRAYDGWFTDGISRREVQAFRDEAAAVLGVKFPAAVKGKPDVK